MQSFSVADVAAMLGVREESVRRWIREGKLVAERRMGRTGSSVTLADIVAFANQPPRTYVKALSKWLGEHNIDYSLKNNILSSMQETTKAATAGVVAGTAVGTMFGFPGALLGATAGSVTGIAKALMYPEIVLSDSEQTNSSNIIAAEESASRKENETINRETVGDKESATEEIKTDVSNATGSTDDYHAKIIEEQMKLITLKQELARISAEISITEGQIEYYKLMLQK